MHELKSFDELVIYYTGCILQRANPPSDEHVIQYEAEKQAKVFFERRKETTHLAEIVSIRQETRGQFWTEWCDVDCEHFEGCVNDECVFRSIAPTGYQKREVKQEVSA